MTGTIKKLSERGFGFITPDDSETDIFFHCSALPNKGDFDGLAVGSRVTYSVVTGDNGKPKADDVTVI